MEISRKTEAFVAEERTATLFVALELSKTRWLVAVESPALNRVSRHTAWIHLASATFDLKAAISSAMVSAGVFHPSVLRGRPFMSRATSLSQV